MFMRNPRRGARNQSIIWLLAFLICLSACAPALPARPADRLVIAAPEGLPAEAALAAAEAYEELTGTATQVQTFGADDYPVQVQAGLLAGLDRYDVVYLPAESLAKWALYHAIRPLDGLQASSDLAAWLPLVTVDGQVYGLPSAPDMLVLWHRADLLEEANLRPPASWEEFALAAEVLTTGERSGAALAVSEESAGQQFAAVVRGFGGEIVTQDGEGYRPALNSEAALRALALYSDLREADLLTGGAEKSGPYAVIDQLAAGSAAMGIGPISAAEQLLDCEASPEACRDGRPLLAWTWLPGLDGSEVLGGLDAWAIPLHARQGEQAAQFIAWLSGQAGAQALASGGMLPANSSVLAGLPDSSGGPALAQIQQYSLLLPPLVNADRVWKAVNTAVHEAFTGESAPNQALEAAGSEIGKALRQGGE